MRTTGATTWEDLDPILFTGLAADYGTPFYLYDADLLKARVARVRAAFGGLSKIYFAVKANPNLELLRAIRDGVDGLDISSAGELDQAILAGHHPATFSFAGPAKTATELAAAVAAGVGSISVESPRELSEIIAVARRSRTRANILLRVNPILAIKEYGMKMGGRPVQFGIDEEELPAVARTVLAHLDVLTFRGLHVYTGSQCFEVDGIVRSVEDTLRLAGELEAVTGLASRVLNFGGGFGVSHGEHGRELDVEAVGRVLSPRLAHHLGTGDGERSVVFELGRYLAAEAGIYVTRVISSKISRGRTFFLVDGGLHHHLAAGGMFGVGLRSNYVLRNLSRADAPSVRCDIAGPLCNPTDLLGVNVDLPAPEPGDLIAVMKSGSYAFSASPLLFLGRPTPAELVRRDGVVVVGRPPHTIVEFN